MDENELKNFGHWILEQTSSFSNLKYSKFGKCFFDINDKKIEWDDIIKLYKRKKKEITKF